MRYLLDANVLVHWANDVPGAKRIAAKVGAQPLGQVILSAVTAHELRFLILRSKASARHVAGLQTLVREFAVEHFDLPAAHAAADVRWQLEQLEQIGRPLGVFDMLLAGHARRLGAAVVTDDEDFARVPGLKTENWLR